MKDKMDTEVLNIPEFYAGRSILITGGSGFLGKAFIEKLMRSCPDFKEIFLLMRPKKGMSVDERLNKILSSPLYDKVRETNPSAFKRLIPVMGDVAKEGLGLDSIQRQVLIDRVSVILHVAANVRFDDSLRDAVFVNTRSTRDICILAGSMKKLVALLHVSSTYAHADRPVVEEIFYPFDVDWKKTIKIAENVDNNLLKVLTAKYLGTIPNTYTFTKRLAESVINDYSDRLPCVIARPSIVISTIEDPIAGWLDNFHGPTGLMIGGGKGVLRTIYADPDIVMDYMPVDVAIKAMIAVCCKRGRITLTKDPSLHIYNCSANNFTKLSMKQVIDISLKQNKTIPLDNCIWQPNTKITKCYYYFYINVLIFHLLPALILDEVLKFTGHKPILLKLQRQIFVANVSVSYFMLNQWEFRHNKVIDLTSKLSGPDISFYYNYHNFQIIDFMNNAILGAKKYLLREDINQLEKATKHQNRMRLIDRICKVLWLVFLFWAFDFFGYLSYLCGAIDDMIHFFINDRPIS